MAPVRCLFLVFNFPAMGTYMRARALARLFVARGHEVTLCAVSPRRLKGWDERPVDGFRQLETSKWVPFDAIDCLDGWGPLDVAQRVAFALRGRYDLVYAFEHKPSSLLPALAARVRGAFLLHDHCDPWGGPDGIFHGYALAHPDFLALPGWKRGVRRAAIAVEERLERWAPRHAHAATAISALTLADLRAWGVPAARSARLYTPSMLAPDSPPDRTAARDALGLPRDAPAIALLASNVPEEAALWPLWRGLLERSPRLLLLLPGNGFRQVPAWAREGELGARIRLPGYVRLEDVPTWLAAADLLWCPMAPTRFNAGRFPHKFFDYVAAGRAVAATRVGDIADLVVAHDLGFVADSLDDLAAASLDALARPGRLAEWGAAARRAASCVFSPAEIDRQLAAFLRDVLPPRLAY